MRIYSIFILLYLTCLTIRSESYNFARLDNTQGLSSNQVISIFKDSRGFMWFGTNLGLNRYDGHSFKTFKYKKNDPGSLPHNSITDIQEDHKGNLWIHTNHRTYVIYERLTDKFIHNIDSILTELGLPGRPKQVEIDKHKNYYFYYENIGLYKYNIHEQSIQVYEQSADPDTFSSGSINKIKISGNYIWVVFSNGLIERLNEETRQVDFQNSHFVDNISGSTISKSLFIDTDNDVWLYPGANDTDIAYYDTSSKQWVFIGKELNSSLMSSFITNIIQDEEGYLWIASDHGGINIYDKKNKTIKHLTHDIYDEASISENSVISIYRDNEGIIWAGTFKNGICYYHPKLYKFRNSPILRHFRYGNNIFDCNVFYKDKKDNLWIGTNGKGLIKYNEQEDKVKVFTHDLSNPHSISSDIIISLMEDHSNTLWIGTYLGGLNSYKNETFQRYQKDEYNRNTISDKNIYSLFEDNKHNLWIGTLGDGINILDPTRKNFSYLNRTNNPELHSNNILGMFPYHNDKLYLSTTRGVMVVDMQTKKTEPFLDYKTQNDSLTNLQIASVIIDSRNLVWIATSDGLNIYNPLNNKFIYYTEENGLHVDEIVSLVEDNNGNIWAGTNKGLLCFYCSYINNELSITFSVFDSSDGLPGNICNPHAMYKDADGLIYVGFSKGYVCFNPDDIAFNRIPPRPRITELYINNKEIHPGEKYNNHVFIKESVTELKKIALTYKDKELIVHFSSMNYIQPEKSRYKYQLKGIDKEWIYTNNPGISYSKLPPGKYQLIVHASNNDLVWSEEPAILTIEVKPPFWMTWWAFGLYSLAIIGIIWGFLKYKISKEKEKFSRAQQVMEAKKAHELNEMKLKFFTNISHEFKTPLTLILTPVEKLLKESLTNEQSSLITIIHRNAQALLEMVNEILDFRKLDVKKMSLNTSVGDIITFIREIYLSFSTLAMEKSIKYSFSSYINELHMDFDPEKMRKIIVNLLSNAFKFTESGMIDVAVSMKEIIDEERKQYLCIQISDTGRGIEKKHLEKIFDRFYRIEHAEKKQISGTGVGLHLVSEYVKLHEGEITVESEQGKGSIFKVSIPVKNIIKNTTEEIFMNYSAKDDEKKTEINLSEELKPVIPGLPLLLIVDDNEDFLKFTSSLFKESYQILTAENGKEALTIVLSHLPDIILCDIMMPVMDGYEFCRKVKEDIRTSHIPVILLTAKSSEENKYHGIEAGADDYISKPFDIDMLTLKIAKIIEKQKKLHARFKNKISITTSEVNVSSMDEELVKKAISVVEKNLENSNFLVEDLCREVGLSRVYFYKKILALTDKTPSEFMRFIRLQQAAELLQKSQLFVNEIAYKVGFKDAKIFRKYFKDEFGVSPIEYKKQFSEK